MFQMTSKSVARRSKKRKHELGRLIKVNGRTIGQVYNGVFEKDVSSKKHFLHYPEEAIAFSISALYAAQRAGAEFVEVLDTDRGIRYRTTIQKYFDLGEKFCYGEKWGDQIKLTLPNFLQTLDPEYKASTSAAQECSDANSTHDVKPLHYESRATVGIVKNGVQQLSLFSGGAK